MESPSDQRFYNAARTKSRSYLNERRGGRRSARCATIELKRAIHRPANPFPDLLIDMSSSLPSTYATSSLNKSNLVLIRDDPIDPERVRIFQVSLLRARADTPCTRRRSAVPIALNCVAAVQNSSINTSWRKHAPAVC